MLLFDDEDERLARLALEAGALDAGDLLAMGFLVGRDGARGPTFAARLRARLGPEAFERLTGPTATLHYGQSTSSQTVADPKTLGLDTKRFERRYTFGEVLGEGGVGTVRAAQDQLMGRTVAVKILRHSRDAEAARRRFITEAQTSAQLEHPNVVPIYDLGALPDGTPCFTMKRVHGRALHEVLLALKHSPDGPIAAEFGRYRLLQILSAVCMAVDYAHSKGVIHRDLKPDNIMVGDFGEVLLMDWGIAKASGERRTAEVEPVVVLDTDPGELTMVGSIVGTPGYMAPEQARAEPVDQRADVWALGAILYQMLTGARPFEEKSPLATLISTATKPVPAPSVRAPERDIPADLEEICTRATAFAPSDRYPTVRALHDDLDRALAGTRAQARRAEAAAAQVAEGEDSRWYMQMLIDELEGLSAQLSSLPPLGPDEPLEVRRERWEMEDRRRKLAKELRQAFSWAEGKFQRALELVPQHAEARDQLGQMHWSRYRAARAANDADTADDHLKAVARYSDTELKTRVSLHVTSDPPGAEVVAWRYVERDRVLTPVAPRHLGRTPIEALSLPTGHHLIELRLPERPSAFMPLRLWVGDAPRLTVPIPTQATLGEGFVYVPGGPFVRGDDPQAVLPAPTAQVNVAPFAIAQVPVTRGDYTAFLDTLPPEEAARRQPRTLGRPLLGDDASLPVRGVTYHDAEAYAVWRSARDGATCRLPTSDEWEKAARGTDGRRFPWGDHFDPTFCCMRQCCAGAPAPQPVGAFKTDRSPYGVSDLAGGVQEWTSDWFEAEQRTLRGGAYDRYALWCRAAGRQGAAPDTTDPTIGFRLVRPL